MVRAWLERPDALEQHHLDQLRYVLSFSRVTELTTEDGTVVDLDRRLAQHALHVRDTLRPRLERARGLRDAVRALPELVRRTVHVREEVLSQGDVDRASLEAEVTTRVLAVVAGGGGGAGYVYPGAYDLLERSGLMPQLLVGTSMGALTSIFRARRRRYDPAPQFAAVKRLSWNTVFRVLDSRSRYGLPATLRLYLQAALGSLFRSPDGEGLRLSQLEIPMYVVATGLTVDALKHDLTYYEHLLDDELGRGRAGRVRGAIKTVELIRELLRRPDALVEMVLGRLPGTEGFDVLDAAGFSSAVPGVIHYDVLRDDPRMHTLLDALYAEYGITRLGEGGLTANVPARVAWESVVAGRIGPRRDPYVLAMDCFAPSPRSLAWLPLQQIAKSNADVHKPYADSWITFPRTLSPMNLVPKVRDTLQAMEWGKAALAPEIPFAREMMRPLPVLPQET